MSKRRFEELKKTVDDLQSKLYNLQETLKMKEKELQQSKEQTALNCFQDIIKELDRGHSSARKKIEMCFKDIILDSAARKVFNEHMQKLMSICQNFKITSLKLPVEETPLSDESMNSPESNARKRRKCRSVPKLPKRYQTAFSLYKKDAHIKVKQDYPNFTVTEITREIGHRWAHMSQDDKATYNELAAEDRRRFAKEMEVYEGAGANHLKKSKLTPADSNKQAGNQESEKDQNKDNLPSSNGTQI